MPNVHECYLLGKDHDKYPCPTQLLLRSKDMRCQIKLFSVLQCVIRDLDIVIIM